MPNQSTGDNPKTGQSTATTTAAGLPSNVCQSVLVQNDPSSSVNVYVGDPNNQYICLQPGQSITIPCSNIDEIYIKTQSSTATVNYMFVV
jgi:hypothetical protein